MGAWATALAVALISVSRLAAPSSLAFHEGFAGRVKLRSAPTGQQWSTVGAPTSAADPRVINGRLTDTSRVPGVSVAYAQVQLPSDITRIGAQFSFGHGRTPNGAVGVIVWASKLTSITFHHQVYPRVSSSPCHLAIAADAWSYGIWTKNVGLRVLAGARFAHPLSTAPGAVYRVDVLIRGATARFHITRGARTVLAWRTVHSPRIKQFAGPYASFEIFALHSRTDSKAAFEQVWANAARSR